MNTLAVRLDSSPEVGRPQNPGEKVIGELVDIDWAAADAVAARLGVHTRQLVAHRDASAVRKWALKLAKQCVGGDNGARSARYLDLAVLCGHEPEPADDEQDAAEDADATLPV